MDDIQLFNDDCFNIFPTLEDKSINLFILDLPYGQTACHWDSVIDLDEMWKHIKRIMKPNALIIFFCTAKFGNTLINANPKWFKYDLIWKKSRKVGFLSANKMPLRQHENIYVFDNTITDDIDRSRNKDLREYAEKVKKFINKPLKEIQKKLGNMGVSHFYSFKGSQFGLPTKKTYNFLIKEYNIDEMEDYLEYDILESLWEGNPTYNPQKTEGKPYKNGAIPNSDNVYGTAREKGTVTKTDRHPTSIIDHENIYLFENMNEYNEEKEQDNIDKNKYLVDYSKKVLKFIGKTKKEILKKNKGVDHFFRYSRGNFSLPIKKNYEKLIEEYNIDEMDDYLEYDILKGLWEKPPPKIESTYNSQKTEGKPYKTNETELTNSYFRGGAKEYKTLGTENKGDRHPTSIIPEYEGDTILVYKNPHKTIHRTQKPVELLEWLIKTYSNEGDTVMDFTMGSGTCAVGCINTKRKFIGVEMDKEIYDLAFDRIEKHKKNI